MWISMIAVFVGSGLGALMRWGLGLGLNPLFPTVPLGTLAANVIGCLLMGLVLGFLGQIDALSPTLRLAITTGFLGGLTTFSTFSAETVTLILRGEIAWAGVAVASHVGASLLAILGGIGLASWIMHASGAPQ